MHQARYVESWGVSFKNEKENTIVNVRNLIKIDRLLRLCWELLTNFQRDFGELCWSSDGSIKTEQQYTQNETNTYKLNNKTHKLNTKKIIHIKKFYKSN